MMYEGCKKYIPFKPEYIPDRTWPDNVIKHAPIWCSVDLRDGNQALIDPMNLEEKLEYFQTLVDIGFKEIEVGFPSASETEYEILRTLIERNMIPDDVTIQVLVQAREHLIKRTFEAIDGAKNVILHFYNSTSTLQRKVVFRMEMDGIIKIATDAAALIRKLSEPMIAGGMNLRYEYSPESFSGTEMDNAALICQKVIETIGATPQNKIILNLPATVEGSMPNQYADQIEYFIRHLPSRDCAIISVHPHNDRGTGVATTEMALLAGAERVEGTLFGNGERTGNVDIVTVAMNMYTQGVDPHLDFSHINRIKEMYERCTKMVVPPRQPYAGELVFTDNFQKVDVPHRNQDEYRVQQMLTYIQKNFVHSITVGDIAGAAGIGERECLRCFQKTIHVPPIQYLLKYRIMQGAEALLARPTDSIAEIAVACGFDSPSNFSQHFRRFYNCTPREYRSRSV